MSDETVEQWIIGTRRAQGLPDHVEDEAVLTELAHAVLEASEEGGPVTVIRRLPGQPRPREKALQEYQEVIDKIRKNLAHILWDFFAPGPEGHYRWRVQLDCGCIREPFTLGEDKLPTQTTYRGDQLYFSKLKPGQMLCVEDEHARPQPYQGIVKWEKRREITFPADPVESRYPEIDQETWAKMRHTVPHTKAFWTVTLSCGHRSEVCTDAEWKPEDGPRRVSPERLQEMTADSEEYWTAHPDAEHEREREHDRRMLAQGWPMPQTETLCFVCSRVRQIVACERVGWLVPRSKRKPTRPKQPSKAGLQRRLQQAEKEAAQLREQLARLQEKQAEDEPGDL
jgi:hypothetical protein